MRLPTWPTTANSTTSSSTTTSHRRSATCGASLPGAVRTCRARGRNWRRCCRNCWRRREERAPPARCRRSCRAAVLPHWPDTPLLPYSLRPCAPGDPMARITVEDCLENVDNLFQLVLLAAQRARRLANGAEPTLPLENDKPTVLALREIAAGNVTAEMLREPEPVPEAVAPDADNQSSFRAPQFGLGD